MLVNLCSAILVVMDDTLDPNFFKPFQAKNFGSRDVYPCRLEGLAVNNLVYFRGNSGWAYDCNSFLGYLEIT